jgi:hypothetical protein
MFRRNPIYIKGNLSPNRDGRMSCASECDFSACWPAQSRSEYFAGPGLLHKSNDPNVFWICTGLEFQLNGFVEALSLLYLSYSCELQHNRHVRQVPAAVFAMQNLRLDAIESDGHKNVGVMFGGAAISANARPKNSWVPGVNAHLADAYRNLRRRRSFVHHFVHLLRIVSAHFAGTIHNELGSVSGLQPKGADIGGLTFSQCSRGVWIFPAVMVPIIHVFTKDDELRACNGRGSVHPLEERVRGRAAGTTFRREQLNENGMSLHAQGLGSRGFVFGLLSPPVDRRRRLQEQDEEAEEKNRPN